MTSLVVGSKSFSFKHKNFQKNTFSYYAQHSRSQQYIVSAVLVTVCTPLPTRWKKHVSSLTALVAIVQPRPLPVPLPWPQRSPQRYKLELDRCLCAVEQLPAVSYRCHDRCQSHSGLEAVSAVLRFFCSSSISTSLRHHNLTSKRIPRL